MREFPSDDTPIAPLVDGPIRRVNPLNDDQWDAKIAWCSGASFFHSKAWAEVLHATYGFSPAYFVQESEGKIRSLLPLMEVDSWLTGRRGISLPFTDECEPLGPTAREVLALVHEANRFGQKRDWRHWEIRGGTTTLQATSAVSFFGHHVDLDDEPAEVLARCGSAARRGVRKAEGSKLTISFAQSMEATRAFHALLCKTRRRHGLPPQPLLFFENIYHCVLRPQHGCIVLASLGDRPVSGAVFFQFGNNALYKFGASDEAFQHLRPNNLVMWRALEWHAKMGFSKLDLGRTSLDNEGLRRFKLGWGAHERKIDYAHFDCKQGAYIEVKDRSSGWHSCLFKHIPTSLARLVGSLAYRHVA